MSVPLFTTLGIIVFCVVMLIVITFLSETIGGRYSGTMGLVKHIIIGLIVICVILLIVFMILYLIGYSL